MRGGTWFCWSEEGLVAGRNGGMALSLLSSPRDIEISSNPSSTPAGVSQVEVTARKRGGRSRAP